MILKTKADLKERPDNIYSHLRIIFPFNWLVIIWRGEPFVEIGRPRSREWKNFGPTWRKGVGNLSPFKSFVPHWIKLCSGNIFTASSTWDFVSSVFQQTIHLSCMVLSLILEAVVQRCSLKKMFLDISQNPQESTCARVSFLIKFWFTPQRLLFRNSSFFSVELT